MGHAHFPVAYQSVKLAESEVVAISLLFLQTFIDPGYNTANCHNPSKTQVVCQFLAKQDK